VVPPSFDVVRVEGNGSIVIAGKAVPNATVDLLVGSKVIGTTTADAVGDFAVVLDDPLKPGDYQIVLRATTPDNIAAMSVETAVVSVPETEDGQVLALVEEPGKPSQMIMVPKPQALAPSDSPPAAPEAPAAEEPATAEPKPAERNTPEKPSGETQAALPAETAPAAAPAPTPSKGPAVRVEAVEIDGRKIFVAGTADAGRTVRGYANEILLGDAQAAPDGSFLIEAERDLKVGDYIIRVDALEPDGVKVAARAAVPFEREPGETIAAFAPPPQPAAPPPVAQPPAEQQPVGQPPAAEVPATPETPAAPQTPERTAEAPAAAPIQPPAAEVQPPAAEAQAPAETAAPAAPAAEPQATAEAPQAQPPVTETPATEAPSATADQPAAQPPTAAAEAPAPADDAPAAKPAPTPAESQPPPVSPGQQATQQPAAGQTDAPAEPAETPASPPAVAQTPVEQPATAQPPTAQSPDAPAAPEPDAGPAAEPETNVATAPAESSDLPSPPSAGGVAEVLAPKLQSVDSAVIIRRGDSLWRISRRVYGRGVRYSTIYLANQKQIEDPDRIWPGQVFKVPEKSNDGEADADYSTLGENLTTVPAEGEGAEPAQ
jgi:nucleoid-associated protein YgaU